MALMFEKLFRLMVEKHASDLFITAGTPIHIKIEGNTMPINQQIMEPAMIERLLYELLTDEQAEVFKRSRELNISHGIKDVGNFRINALWQRNSVAVVVRFIQRDIPELDTLGLPPILSELVMENRGLILVVGSTGSGKSTTLASMIDHRNRNHSGHILTVEDPIEYLFRHQKSVVNQREVGIDTHSWHEALRNAMRQAPDCILIGEIRDRETMQAAIAYAQTGHLCLATLHASNAYHALNRIVSFFPLENRALLYMDLSVALRCVISQRLVRKPDKTRLPAIEILLNTRHIADLVERGDINSIKEAMEQSLAPGSQTFEQDLYRLYNEKIITLDEALANSDSPTNLSWLINNRHFEQGNFGNHAPGIPSLDSHDPSHQLTDPDGASFQEFSLKLDSED